jgi:hypothetical protein
MAKQRASIFDTGEQLDVSGFTPKPKTGSSAPLAEEVWEVSLAAQFRSNVQFNVKVLAEDGRCHLRDIRRAELGIGLYPPACDRGGVGHLSSPLTLFDG